MTITSVRLQADLHDSLEVMAAKVRRSKSWVINEALREYLARSQAESDRWTETLSALESLQSGRVVAGDNVHAWLESWGTESEVLSPKSQ